MEILKRRSSTLEPGTSRWIICLRW